MQAIDDLCVMVLKDLRVLRFYPYLSTSKRAKGDQFNVASLQVTDRLIF